MCLEDYGVMPFINSYYVDTPITIHPSSLKSGALRRLFNIGSGNIIGIVNTYKCPTLLFIYEKKSTPIELQLISHVFLSVIHTHYASMLGLSNQQLLLDGYPISAPYFHYTKNSSIFAHSIVLRAAQSNYYVSHLPVEVSTFACETLNTFKEQLGQIMIDT